MLEYAVLWPEHDHAGETVEAWVQRGMGADRAFAERVALHGWNKTGEECPPHGVVMARMIGPWTQVFPVANPGELPTPGVSD